MPVINTTGTFVTGQQVTSNSLNYIADESFFVADAVVGTTLQVLNGKLKLGTVTSSEMGTNSVTTNSINNLSVITEKINDLAVITTKINDLAVTTEKINDLAITTGKIINANITPEKLSQPFTLGTSQNSTSGTSIIFTSIPTWAKRITIVFSSVSTSGSSNLLIKIGDSEGIESTGYNSVAADFNGNTSEITTGFVLDRISSASAIFKGSIVLNLVTGTTFVSNGILAYSDVTYGATVSYSGGVKTLSGQLDRISITTINGTDTFDSGLINIMYE